MSRAMGIRIGALVGQVEDVEVDDNGVGRGEYLWLRIVLDLSKPLSRGRRLKLGERSLWIAFKYEKIPKFCFRCGTIKHGNRECIKVVGRGAHGADNKFEFGPWLRVGSSNNKGEGRYREGWKHHHSLSSYHDMTHHFSVGRSPGENEGHGEEANGRHDASTTVAPRRGKPGRSGGKDNMAPAQEESEKSRDSFCSDGEELNSANNEKANWGRKFSKNNVQGGNIAEASNCREARNLGDIRAQRRKIWTLL
jgi:hypothetical protein